MTENQRLKKIAENVFIFLSITVLSFGKINSISPFHYAFFYVAFLEGKGGVVSVIAMLLSYFYDGVSFREVIFSTTALLPIIFNTVYVKTVKKEILRPLKIIFCIAHFCVSSAVYVGNVHVINVVVNGILTLCFTFAFRLCYALVKGGAKAGVTDTLIGCTAFVFLSYGAGFSGIYLFSTPLLILVAGFIIPFLSCVVSKELGVICAIALGSGYAVCYYDVTYIALFGFCSLCIFPFSSSRRVFPLISSLMGITVFELYFWVNYASLPYHLAFWLLGGIVFALLPAKLINAVRVQKTAQSESIALRYLINKNRVDTANKIARMKEIFLQMSVSLSFMRGDTDKVSQTLAKKTEEDVCKSCENYRICGKKQLGNALVTLSRLTLIKNKATITSLPPLLEKDCIHLASLVGASYNNSLAIRKDVARMATQNQVKSALASTLKNISDVLFQYEKIVGAPLGFDYDKEEKIKEELALCGVVCKQVYVSLGHDFEVTLLVKRDTYDENFIQRAVSGALKIDSVIQRADDSVIKGWTVVNLIEKPVYSLVVAIASKAKEGASGDTHSFTEISNGAVMVALCDGMGSGEKAERTSDNAVSLIEGFYKAGFDHDVTLKSVNTFLKTDNDESFSALDVMVFDRKTGQADLIKLASPPTYIKKSTRTIRVDASSLPIGIVNEITPSVTTRQVEDGDCFVFVTDGVYDCFEGDTLSAFINNHSAKNPSVLASAVLDEALKRIKTPSADMPALVCKVIIAL